MTMTRSRPRDTRDRAGLTVGCPGATRGISHQYDSSSAGTTRRSVIMPQRAFGILLTITILLGVPVSGRAQEATPLLTASVMATPTSPGTAITTEEVARITVPTSAIPPPPVMVD